jgi:flavin reductase (DIM6/NTAB) family NADH-FMN oxidoreductase RutF
VNDLGQEKELAKHIAVDPASLTRLEQYKLLTGVVVPRPIALVTTLGPAGLNAAPFSFFNAIGADPPMIMFSVGRRSNGMKDTIRNIEATNEFVVHIVDVALREKMNICGTDYGPGVNELEEAGFRTAPSVRVGPPRIIDCPVQLECRTLQMLTMGHYDVVFGEVVYFHFRPGVIDDRLHTNVANLDPLGRLSGPAFLRVTETINMPRLPVPPGKEAAAPGG